MVSAMRAALVSTGAATSSSPPTTRVGKRSVSIGEGGPDRLECRRRRVHEGLREQPADRHLCERLHSRRPHETRPVLPAPAVEFHRDVAKRKRSDPLRCVRHEMRRDESAEREPADVRARDTSRVEHGNRVARQRLDAERLKRGFGGPMPAQVEPDDMVAGGKQRRDGVPHAKVGAERAYEQDRRATLAAVFPPVDPQSIGVGVRHMLLPIFGCRRARSMIAACWTKIPSIAR